MRTGRSVEFGAVESSIYQVASELLGEVIFTERGESGNNEICWFPALAHAFK
ncbi:MAG: hypothetical protein FWD73_04775 [Polyangiaceae bacterium]|nr:hypothetical protein [Polyangiaceae bacterium]